jgi:hypothetical protein
MYKFMLAVLFLVMLTTCSKRMCGCDPAPPPNHLTATVLETNEANCSRPLLLFQDSIAVVNYTGISSTKYIVNQLPDSVKVAGKKILVVVGLLNPSEDFACTGTVPPTYPHLQVISAAPAP